ncbi:hypothetical protein J437_LFUL012538 [Ladona fulva]|uniref:Uncharacterized protein n=1 Tax=Ladona fulva TaxID=123851 RepID=A0A8K0KEQ8_LADFU|nr:hypothetical protein J437_LFUL012538 [Ladona fulva]
MALFCSSVSSFCKVNLSYKGGTTSNLQKHLNSMQPTDPSHQLPSQAMLRTLMPQKYESIAQTLKMHLSTDELIMLTTNGRTSTANETYLAITEHFISKQWETFSAVLNCFKLDGRHTAEKLTSERRTITIIWG